MQFLSENNDFSGPVEKRDAKNERAECAEIGVRNVGGVYEESEDCAADASDADSFDFAFEERILDFFAEFAAGAGHEINNPLAIISGRAQKLLREETSPAKRRELAAIVEQTRRAFEMIADIRLFARPPKPEFSKFSLKSFFQDWIRREEKRVAELGAPIETQVCWDFNGCNEDGLAQYRVEDDEDDKNKEDSENIRNNEYNKECEDDKNKYNGENNEDSKSDEDNVDIKNAENKEGDESGELLTSDDAVVESDREMLAAILDALGKNAVEAVANGGRLAFFCEIGKDRNGNKIGTIGVESDGNELSEETRRLIFSPFFSGRQAGRGLGFGLPKSWRFAKELGAKLLCEKSKKFCSGARWSVRLTVR